MVVQRVGDILYQSFFFFRVMDAADFMVPIADICNFKSSKARCRAEVLLLKQVTSCSILSLMSSELPREYNSSFSRASFIYSRSLD